MTAILRYDAACQAIAAAKSVDEVNEWIDKAAAVKEYSRRVRNRQIEIDAIEIRVRAKKKRGELLLQMKERGELREGKPKLSSANDSLPRYTLTELGVTADESSEDQKIAKIDEGSFERLVARCRTYTEANPQKHSFDVLKPPPERGPINGAASVMGSRQEPDDSLDYFPTPPWATRTLMNVVFPTISVGPGNFASVWDPACGEGHITGVMEEFPTAVIGTDIHDYSADGRMPPAWLRVQDFLKPEAETPAVDWIVTNPPFGDEAIKFVNRALELANVGVAMFFRSQWAVEGIERYNEIFRDRPPTICAFFVERVPLVKGRWDPDATTATAYCWLVWKRDELPRPTFWIPPGQRVALTREGDVERFTAQPVAPMSSEAVVRKMRDEEWPDRQLAPHDPETGEIIEPPVVRINPDTHEIIERKGNDHAEREREEERAAGDEGNSGGGDREDQRRLRIAEEERPERQGDHHPDLRHDAHVEDDGGAGAGSAPATEGLVLPVDREAKLAALRATIKAPTAPVVDVDLNIPDDLLRVELSKKELATLNRLSLEDADRDEQEFITRARKHPESATVATRNRIAEIAKAQGLTTEQAL